ncbi:MAG: Coenzyme F420 hydrogenase/dehydrogenase, beta subunit C-terminal domain [Deltaproteobacteria bacterium]|nr:Coenzyme F420 hydrogenase/dehydrogenase, beta subunit C-terminal domain [Deltaproteobacteria bacterium]
MGATAKLEVKDNDPLASLEVFFKAMLKLEDISAVLVPRQLPMKKTIMPALVSDPESIDCVYPLAPVFPLNAARIVSRLTRKPSGGKVAAVLRPCEIRAFYELVKLKQGTTDELVIVGVDCLGAYKNTDYFRFAAEDVKKSTTEFYRNALAGKTKIMEGIDLAPACKACEYPVPSGADITIGLFGVNTDDHFLIMSQSHTGDELLGRLELSPAEEPASRQEAIDSIVSRRIAYRDNMFAETREATNTLEKLTSYLAGCTNCYNCRVACPVCYCKECVFVTDVFNHEPSQYLQWAMRKGAIKMPTDTVFYHITRLAHMSTACVGCGQCSNACPNDIHVMELFRMVADSTQKAFDYQAGRSLEEKPPLSVFREDEFEEVVGIASTGT